ncbi:PEPxxWA-CTERM sorting domain-containing protein [Phenylobacterium sp.]|uniref:Npun_F0296 family exosortase-dependent surface protein n=1 Tax=Phenylobacterium sp. TaxID=1871053 RepID=UPI00286A3D0F|nr:PEPxxWA-CTERM sorting domain-containing protein [Phenylobacterium sp.]
MSNFKKILVGAVFAATAALGATAANAAVVLTSYSSFQDTLNAYETLVTNFGAPLAFAPGWGISGTYAILNGTSSSGAAPKYAIGVDPTDYLSVKKNQTATITGPGARNMSFYIGSLDDYNTITFYTVGGGVYSFTGTQLGLVSGASDGNRTAPVTNGRFTFVTDPTDLITSVALASSENSFEVSNIGSAVPEPATWAMMIIGFGGVGSMLRSSRRKQAAAFA